MLDPIVAERGDDLALADDDTRVSWAELDLRVRRLINALAGLGVGPEDTIAVVMGNRREYFEIAMAATHLGFRFVPVNWHLVAEEVAYVLADADVGLVVAGDRFGDLAREALDRSPRAPVSLVLVGAGGSADGALDYEELLVAAPTTDLANERQRPGGPMFYTSGTTGHPKGVRSANRATDLSLVSAAAERVLTAFTLPKNGRSLLVGPVYHSAQHFFSFYPMLSGSSVVMRHSFDAGETLRLVDSEQVTNVHLVPTQFKRLLDVDDRARQSFDGSSLEVVWHGAAPCPPPWKRALIEWLGPKISEYYGSTELGIVTRIDSSEWLRKGGSVGKPILEVLLLDDDNRVIQEPNTAGTVYVRNPAARDFEYHNAPEKTAEVHLEPGVATSGDVGFLDDEGYLWLSDRKIDLIISGGVNIYPAEIEAVLARHPAVRDVAVIGVPNEEFGEEVKAVVEVTEPEDSLTPELMSLCESHLARYKHPRSIDFRVELPRTGSGKILKRALREPYWTASGQPS